VFHSVFQIMRLMSYIREHPKTGIYWYRRAVPPHLRGRVPRLDGFPENQNRAEFTRSLGTRSKAVANRLAAKLNEVVEMGLSDAANAVAAPELAPLEPINRALRPGEAFQAIDAWEKAERAEAETRLFNGDATPAWFEKAASAHPDVLYFLQQREPDKVPGFDAALLSALGRTGLLLREGHPALTHLRKPFAAAWYRVLRAVEHMRSGTWAYEIEEAAATTPATVPARAGPKLEFKADEWGTGLGLKSRQNAMYVSDVRQFAAAITDADVTNLTHVQVQEWATASLKAGLTAKTLKRKLSAIRLYWRYLRAHGHTNIPMAVFTGLYLRDIATERSTAKEAYQPEAVVKLWNAARARPEGEELAKLIKLAAFSGGRIESLCQLRKASAIIDPRTKIMVLAFDDKTEAGRREVPVPNAFRPFVERLIRDADKDGFLVRANTGNKHGERSTPLGKMYGRLKAKEGFGKSHDFHSFRRTVATLLENSGCPENFAADILGHEKPGMSYGVYSGGTGIALRKEWLDKAIHYPDASFMSEA
jgi:integrase